VRDLTKKLWGGRFKKKTDPHFEKFSASLVWDARLAPYDLKIDAAHVGALKRCGVLRAREAARLLSAIARLEKKYRDGSLLSRQKQAEDVHSAIQAELASIAGPLADKLHTARSRNDLVSQSSRLYCKEHAAERVRWITALQKAIVGKAEVFQDVLVPGMTHLQNAQALSQAHIFLSYVEMLERNKQQFALAADFADVCVLGSGALAGVTFRLDQEYLRRRLGLARVTRNSYDVSGDRDFILQFLAAASFLGVTLSRIAEDFMIGQTKGFSLIDIDEAFCTGSSIMPQKKNADFIELARGASGILAGNLAGFLVTLKGLPSSYNRDLQWDKRPLFESSRLTGDLLGIFQGVFATLGLNRARAASLVADDSLYATDLADYLVGKGTPFKRAHDQVGRAVAFSEVKRVPLSRIGLDILKEFMPLADGGIYGIFDARHSVGMKKTRGSTHPAEVARQLRFWKNSLKKGGV